MKKIYYFLIVKIVLASCNSVVKNINQDIMQVDSVVNINRSDDGTYIVKFLKGINYEVAYGFSEDNIDWATKTNTITDSILEIQCDYPEKRLIFALIDNDKKDTLYASERHIKMQGTPNFRDLGGIVTKDKRQIRWGAIFRSGTLADLTPKDLDYFKTLNIKKVIDFRTHGEIEREPDRYPDLKVQAVHAMIGNPADISEASKNSNLKNITAEQADRFMIKAYEDFINSLNDFQPIFDAMLEGRQIPFLFHCTAGKDRTGISAALILAALNVDRSIILNDYLLSNQYNIPYYESRKEKLTAFGDFSDDVVKVFSGVKADYLQHLFALIDNRYTDTEDMLEKVFGITPEKRQWLIDNYTVRL